MTNAGDVGNHEQPPGSHGRGFIPPHGGYEELLEDYRDYLRVNNAAQWDRNSEEALFVRKLGAREGVDYEAFREFFDTRPAEVVAEWRWQMG